MMIADEIRNAESEEVIYLILVSYIDAARFRGNLKNLPKQMVLPLKSKDDVRSRYEALMIALDAASKRLDNDTCITVKEALLIFATALYRLQLLDSRWSWPLNLDSQTAASSRGAVQAKPNGAAF
jgi:hypothetical protein